ncbi:MAG TPA: CotH kinase family protein [Acidimicrobiales bacterium]|nr:CotH kinase family protein [Acidimicrobiales bacterium]
MRRTRSAVAAALTAVSLLGAACSSGGSGNASAAAAAAGADNVALYDNSVVHDIAVTFVQAAYDEMVDAYVQSQDKHWIEATITIDGVTLEKVGMRLKGNSSLRGLARAGGGGQNGVTRTEPESLPWLVRFDKYVEGQTYQGRSEVVIRGNNTETSLNEAVALELIGLSGAATQKAFSTRFTVNGGTQVLRLAIESPNDDWEQSTFDTEGILYKAESTGDYSYRGTDPKSYDEVFDQESDTENENLAPLISFLDFINNSSDATFAADLGKHFDIAAFARYLALQDLVANWDDIDGPGNNSYLRYDEETKQFTVLSWDLNLAFNGTGGPGGAGGIGGAQPPAGAQPPSGGFQPPAGGQPPAGARTQPPGAGQAPAGGLQVRPGGPGGRSNILVQRFQANTTFAAMYNQAKTDLKADLFSSGKAGEVLSRWSGVLTAHAGDLVDAATVERETANISRMFA